MIVPPENSVSVLKQSFLFDKFAIHTSSANLRDVSRSQACQKMVRTFEWTQQTRKQTNEWMVYAPVNVKPQGEGGRSGMGWGFLHFLSKKIQIPTPGEKKLVGQNPHQGQEKVLKCPSNLDHERSKWPKSLPWGQIKFPWLAQRPSRNIPCLCERRDINFIFFNVKLTVFLHDPEAAQLNILKSMKAHQVTVWDHRFSSIA